MTPKHSRGYKFSHETIGILDRWAERHHITRTALIEAAVRDMDTRLTREETRRRASLAALGEVSRGD